MPYLIALATASNTGSVLTVTGNPQNMLIGVRGGFTFGEFLAAMAPVGLGALALREVLAGRVQAAPWYVLLWWSFDAYLKLRRRAPDASPPPADQL